MNPTLLFIDFETYSEADLKEVGSAEYARHISTEVVCAAWRLTGPDAMGETRTWCGYLEGMGKLGPLSIYLRDPRLVKVAHNSGFDRAIAHHVLGIPQDAKNWIDTAAIAAAHALPRDLARACDVLELKRRKNPEGKSLVHRYSKPKRPSKKDPSTRYLDQEGLKRFVKYCADDVDAMVELWKALPPLTPSEREVYLLNQRINDRGVAVDRRLVSNALLMTQAETEEMNTETVGLTGGFIESATQRNRVMEFLEKDGIQLPNLQKKTVEDALAAGLASGSGKRLLEIRQAISKTSTAKYVSFRQRTGADGRVRDLQMYHGASTGREAGMGLQPHNLPKPTLENVPEAVQSIREGNRAWVRCLNGDVMEALSSSIRGALVASPGFEMFAADFNAIEARVLLWLAGDISGLAEFERGDPYKAEAVGIYGKPIDKISDAERQVGKATVLGSGFQMGPYKFFQTCKKNGIEITEGLAKRAIAAYRRKHPKVVKLWGSYERAAIGAVMRPGSLYGTNQTIWSMQEKFLYCQLPSGRKIAYFGAEVKTEITPWGEPRPKLYYWYVDSMTKQWVRGATYGGSLTENVTQAVARDLMVEAQLRSEKLGYIPLFSVHDELVSERKKREGNLEEFEKAMAVLPSWADGLKVRVKGWQGDRYRKA